MNTCNSWMAVGLLTCSSLCAGESPQFDVDATWPAPLPGTWIFGQLGGVCVDSHDHIVVIDRRNITEEEQQIAEAAPPFIMFDASGAVVASWGDPERVPESLHGCSFDIDDNIYVAGNDDGIIQKYSHDGELLLQIGLRGHFDSADDSMEGEPLNASRSQFFLPAAVVSHPDTGEIFVADGYGNRRIAVFDSKGEFLRQWGRQATQDEIDTGAGGVFADVLHCITISNAGLVYVCDRKGNRIQVFTSSGEFVRNVWVRTGVEQLPDSRGTAWWVDFSDDPEQQYLYVMDGRNEQVHVLDHQSGEILSTFGRPGHQAGDFTHGHTLALDSQGNLYVAETNWGRRVQRFRPRPASP